MLDEQEESAEKLFLVEEEVEEQDEETEGELCEEVAEELSTVIALQCMMYTCSSLSLTQDRRFDPTSFSLNYSPT